MYLLVRVGEFLIPFDEERALTRGPELNDDKCQTYRGDGPADDGERQFTVFTVGLAMACLPCLLPPLQRRNGPTPVGRLTRTAGRRLPQPPTDSRPTAPPGNQRPDR